MIPKLKMIILSDGTGETASAMARAAMTQFPGKDVYFTRYKNVRTKDQIESIFSEATPNHDLIVYTMVSPDLRDFVAEMSRRKFVRSVDLMGPILTSISNLFESEPASQPGLLHQVNDDYFKRVEAVEFTLNHDDGRNLKTLEEADVILVGISRTSKTPLSIYLSLEGLKVVNIPLILGTPLPEKIFQIDQRKIFALTIDPETLHQIRINRLTRLGMANQKGGDYADLNRVVDEIEYANNLFKENKRWPVFNVSDKALEETAAEILKILNLRKNNRFR